MSEGQDRAREQAAEAALIGVYLWPIHWIDRERLKLQCEQETAEAMGWEGDIS